MAASPASFSSPTLTIPPSPRGSAFIISTVRYVTLPLLSPTRPSSREWSNRSCSTPRGTPYAQDTTRKGRGVKGLWGRRLADTDVWNHSFTISSGSVSVGHAPESSIFLYVHDLTHGTALPSAFICPSFPPLYLTRNVLPPLMFCCVCVAHLSVEEGRAVHQLIIHGQVHVQVGVQGLLKQTPDPDTTHIGNE